LAAHGGLVRRLKALCGEPGYEVQFALLPDQNHQNSTYPAIIRAELLNFVRSKPIAKAEATAAFTQGEMVSVESRAF